MDETLTLTVRAAISVVCWLIVAGGAALAVFSRRINDTALERIGLSLVSITSVGAAWRVIEAGWASDGYLALAAAMASYVIAVTIKHIREDLP